MRTTVTLDSDVEQLLRDQMEAKGMSFKVALNDAVRRGVGAVRSEAFRTPTADLGITVDLDHANRVVGDLEDVEIVAKLRSGR